MSGFKAKEIDTKVKYPPKQPHCQDRISNESYKEDLREIEVVQKFKFIRVVQADLAMLDSASSVDDSTIYILFK